MILLHHLLDVYKRQEFEGYEVAEAENGMEAVEMVKSEDFDLIVMDLSLIHIYTTNHTALIGFTRSSISAHGIVPRIGPAIGIMFVIPIITLISGA